MWGTASGATITPDAQGHLCFRTHKLSSCPQKPDMCMSSSLELLVEYPFRDTLEFPVCVCSSQLPITPFKRSYSPIPESPAPPFPSLFFAIFFTTGFYICLPGFPTHTVRSTRAKLWSTLFTVISRNVSHKHQINWIAEKRMNNPVNAHTHTLCLPAVDQDVSRPLLLCSAILDSNPLKP